MAEFDPVWWIASIGLGLYGLGIFCWATLAMKNRMAPRETASTVLVRYTGEAAMFLALSGRVLGWW